MRSSNPIPLFAYPSSPPRPQHDGSDEILSDFPPIRIRDSTPDPLPPPAKSSRCPVVQKYTKPSPRRRPLPKTQHDENEILSDFPPIRTRDSTPDLSTPPVNLRKLSRRPVVQKYTKQYSSPSSSPRRRPPPKTGLGDKNALNTNKVTVQQVKSKVNLNALYSIGGYTD